MPSLNLVDYVTKKDNNTLFFLFQGKKRNFSHFLSMIQKTDVNFTSVLSSPYGNRTRVSAVRGRRLNRLTNEPFIILSWASPFVKHFFHFTRKYLQIPDTVHSSGYSKPNTEPASVLLLYKKVSNRQKKQMSQRDICSRVGLL